MKNKEEWKDISTVPYNGKEILIYLPKIDKIKLATYHKNVIIIDNCFSFDLMDDELPSHWRELPDKPIIA